MTKILLVEDQDDVRNALAIALTHQGYDVEAYSNGETALEAIKLAWPEIAIIDSGLPGLSGMDFGRALDEQTGDQKRIFKVLFTGTDSPTLREQARETGFDLFVVKPVSINSLCEELSRLSHESL